MLSDMKVDRETRLRRISADRTFRSHHLNAVADRKLHLQTNQMEKATTYDDRSHRKERKTIQKELLSIHREKSVSVDEYLGQVRERSDKMRRVSHGRDKRRTPSVSNGPDLDAFQEEDPTVGGTATVTPPGAANVKRTGTRSRKKSAITAPFQ